MMVPELGLFQRKNGQKELRDRVKPLIARLSFGSSGESGVHVPR